MGHIRPYRAGYGDVPGQPPGYGCIGISYVVIPPIDCTINRYEKLPPLAKGAVSDIAWENNSAIDLDARLAGIRETCGHDFDPFTGTQVDVYQAFVDQGIADRLEDSCYEVDGRYGRGYLNPTARGEAKGRGAGGGGGGAGPTPSASSSSSSGDCTPALRIIKITSQVDYRTYLADVYGDGLEQPPTQTGVTARCLTETNTGEAPAIGSVFLADEQDWTLPGPPVIPECYLTFTPDLRGAIIEITSQVDYQTYLALVYGLGLGYAATASGVTVKCLQVANTETVPNGSIFHAVFMPWGAPSTVYLTFEVPRSL